ncbi:hypothetical protein [Streptomyces sp. SID11385]|uniref:hypothetical protein n=1 Tax=Streptomyces sp. SID11385 TaxID=2706031 RepID=UPI0013C84BCA|nr:hypothetical protein [Streptomyces sp. SID11385]NEA42736.1 hypothetical protein [Streptomyces sp. SID11385]
MTDAPGVLVAAAAGPHRAVHASPLIYATTRPELGLTPWNPLCATSVVTSRTAEPVTCRTCLAVMHRRGLTLGDTL